MTPMKDSRPKHPDCVIRGGSWVSPEIMWVRLTKRESYGPRETEYAVGFRTFRPSCIQMRFL